MNLEAFSGSPYPNALAFIGLVLLTLVASRRQPRKGLYLAFGGASILFIGAVATKNLGYHLIVSQPNAENNAQALRDYAHILGVVSIAEAVIGASVIVIGLATSKVRWLAASVGLACSYAALCMLDWRFTYLAHDPKTAVDFQMSNVGLHWAALALIAGCLLAAVVTGLRRKSRQPRQ